jgi:hypothetical protein
VCALARHNRARLCFPLIVLRCSVEEPVLRPITSRTYAARHEQCGLHWPHDGSITLAASSAYASQQPARQPVADRAARRAPLSAGVCGRFADARCHHHQQPARTSSRTHSGPSTAPTVWPAGRRLGASRSADERSSAHEPARYLSARWISYVPIYVRMAAQPPVAVASACLLAVLVTHSRRRRRRRREGE